MTVRYTDSLMVQAVGNGFFKQVLALIYDGKDWLLGIQLYPVVLRSA